MIIFQLYFKLLLLRRLHYIILRQNELSFSKYFCIIKIISNSHSSNFSIFISFCGLTHILGFDYSLISVFIHSIFLTSNKILVNMYMLNKCMVKAAFKQQLILDACLQAIDTNQSCINKNNTKYITIYYVE